jgi:RimJ/RimL family protein N-acetyltransferase
LSAEYDDPECGALAKPFFTEEGVLREAEWVFDRWVDLRVFSMLEQDWE